MLALKSGEWVFQKHEIRGIVGWERLSTKKQEILGVGVEMVVKVGYGCLEKQEFRVFSHRTSQVLGNVYLASCALKTLEVCLILTSVQNRYLAVELE